MASLASFPVFPSAAGTLVVDSHLFPYTTAHRDLDNELRVLNEKIDFLHTQLRSPAALPTSMFAIHTFVIQILEELFSIKKELSTYLIPPLERLPEETKGFIRTPCGKLEPAPTALPHQKKAIAEMLAKLEAIVASAKISSSTRMKDMAVKAQHAAERVYCMLTTVKKALPSDILSSDGKISSAHLEAYSSGVKETQQQISAVLELSRVFVLGTIHGKDPEMVNHFLSEASKTAETASSYLGTTLGLIQYNNPHLFLSLPEDSRAKHSELYSRIISLMSVSNLLKESIERIRLNLSSASFSRETTPTIPRFTSYPTALAALTTPIRPTSTLSKIAKILILGEPKVAGGQLVLRQIVEGVARAPISCISPAFISGRVPMQLLSQGADYFFEVVYFGIDGNITPLQSRSGPLLFSSVREDVEIVLSYPA